MADANAALVAAASVQGAAALVLVGITAFYAWRTHDMSKAARQQAEASNRLAEVAEQTRLDQLRPTVRLERSEALSPRESLHLGAQASVGEFPESLDCDVSSLGPGPALNVNLKLKGLEGHRSQTIAALKPGETLDHLKLIIEGESDTRGVRVGYEDVFGRPWETVVEIRLDKTKHALLFGPTVVREGHPP